MAEKRKFKAAYIGLMSSQRQNFHEIWVGKENQWIYIEDESLAKLKKKVLAHYHELKITVNTIPIEITPLPNEIIFYLRLPDTKD